MKKLANLADIHTSTSDVVLEVQSPSKFKKHINSKQPNEEDFSHAGIAIPVDEDSLEMEEVTKKIQLFEREKPTTNSGLSTWILLSGQGASTTREPVIKKSDRDQNKQNLTIIVTENPKRPVKPIFKKKTTVGITTTKTTKLPNLSTKASTPSTTLANQGVKPSPAKNLTKFQTTASEATTIRIHYTLPQTHKTTKLTKVKASELSNALKKTTTTPKSTTLKKKDIATSTIRPIVSTMEAVVNASSLPLEAKTGEVELNNTEKKKRKNTNKRKKNRTRKRKPQSSNSTSLAKPTKMKKEKPVGTMIYNYLSREIMPTVGVGLVGLMVTAGLASYFLYPFGIAAKRADTVDRKDREGYYYYRDQYSGGMPEEEAIGKVIAGMPSNNLFSNDHKPKSTYSNSKYQLVDRRSQYHAHDQKVIKGTVENAPLTNYQTLKYNNNVDDQKFVVGNIPKQEDGITPVTVPEHGPRNFQIDTVTEDYKAKRLKREVSVSSSYSDSDNEISNNWDDYPKATTTSEHIETTTNDMNSNNVSATTLPPNPSLKTNIVVPEEVLKSINVFLELMTVVMQNVERKLSNLFKFIFPSSR